MFSPKETIRNTKAKEDFLAWWVHWSYRKGWSVTAWTGPLAQDVGRVDARISPGFWKRLTEVGWHKEGEGGCRPWTPAVMDNTCHKGE